MKHSELISIITKQTGKTPTQNEIAEVLGLSKNAISSRSHRDAKYDYGEVEKLQNFFNVDFTNQDFIDDLHDDSGEIEVDYYPDVLASCGGGTFELSQVKEKIRIPKMCIKNYMPFARYSVINAYGDSMQPTIQNGDRLIIEFVNHNVIRDNNIYVFFYDDKIFCKRLVQNIDSIVVISDNPDKNIYPTRAIEKAAMNEIHIIGRIAGLMRKL